jgi:hypothetical protein
MIKTAVVTVATLAAVAILGAGCNDTSGSGGGGSNRPPTGGRGGVTISCDELATYLENNMTLANRQALQPLMVELLNCSRLTPGQARDMLNNTLRSQSQVNDILSNWNV